MSIASYLLLMLRRYLPIAPTDGACVAAPQRPPRKASVSVVKAGVMAVLLLGLAACGSGDDTDSPAADNTATMATAITTQPADVSAVIGGPVRFNIVVTGTGLSIKWQQSADKGVTWTDISGATGPVYAIPAMTSSQVGLLFRAVVSGAGGTVTSAVAGLNVSVASVAPAITVGLTPQSASIGDTASFSVTATGTSLSFQWQRSPDGQVWSDIAGAIDAVLRLSGLTPADNGVRIRVIVSNSAGRVTSSPVLLSVSPAPAVPTISSPPVAASVTAPGPVTFSATAAGTPAPSYQWQRSNDGGATFSNITGATSAALTLPSTSVSDNGARFRVVATNSAGSVISLVAVLTVGPLAPVSVAPALTSYTLAQSVVAPNTATFTAVATGTPAPTYQWQVSSDAGVTWVNITGATSASYTTPPTSVGDNGKRFRVIVGNSAGSATGGAGVLAVARSPDAPNFTATPVAASVSAPNAATFTATATGLPAPSYQWQRSNDGGANFTDIAGATAAQYTLSPTATADNGARFRVVATNALGNSISVAAILTVGPPGVLPSITTAPEDVTVLLPAVARFQVVATGVPSPTIQWQVSTDSGATFRDIAGATATAYTTTATQASDDGRLLRAVVRNSAGMAESVAARLTVRATSELQGRTWTSGKLLEVNDSNVVNQSLGIDDAGNAIALFVKSDGSRNVLYATRGVPGAAGAAPTWSAPVAIDTAAAPANTSTRSLVVAPNGDAIVVWVASARCTPTTYSTDTNADCNYLFHTRYTSASGTWSSVRALVDTPSASPALQLRTNSRGDLALLYPGWERSGATSFTTRSAVLWQAAGQLATQSRLFTETLGVNALFLDQAGNLVVAGSAVQNATTDIIAYRGTVGSGFGSQEVLDLRSAVATYQNMAMNRSGQTVVLWTQSNGNVDTRYSAIMSSPTGAWAVKEVEPSSNTGAFVSTALVMADDGNAYYYELANGACSGYFHVYSNGNWSGLRRFPPEFPGCGASLYAFNRNAQILVIDGANWTTYESLTNSVIRANSATVYGTSGGNVGNFSARLSVSGVGVLTTIVPYDALPTVAQPAGDGRGAVQNLWGLFLK